MNDSKKTQLVSLQEKVDSHDRKIEELNELCTNMRKEITEKNEKILKLSEIVKKLSLRLSELCEVSMKNKCDETCRSTSSSQHTPCRPEICENCESEDDISKSPNNKLALIWRKMDEDPLFRQYVDQGLMRYMDEKSLDTLTNDRRQPSHIRTKSSIMDRTYCRQDCPSSCVHGLKKVTKKMTVAKKIYQCDASPSRPIAISYDTKQYLTRFKILQENYSGENNEVTEVNKEFESRPVTDALKSSYRPGESFTFCPDDDNSRCCEPFSYRNRKRYGRKNQNAELQYLTQSNKSDTGRLQYDGDDRTVESFSDDEDYLLSQIVEFDDESEQENVHTNNYEKFHDKNSHATQHRTRYLGRRYEKVDKRLNNTARY